MAKLFKNTYARGMCVCVVFVEVKNQPVAACTASAEAAPAPAPAPADIDTFRTRTFKKTFYQGDTIFHFTAIFFGRAGYRSVLLAAVEGEGKEGAFVSFFLPFFFFWDVDQP